MTQAFSVALIAVTARWKKKEEKKKPASSVGRGCVARGHTFMGNLNLKEKRGRRQRYLIKKKGKVPHMIHLTTGAFVAVADCGDFSSLLTVLIKNEPDT